MEQVLGAELSAPAQTGCAQPPDAALASDKPRSVAGLRGSFSGGTAKGCRYFQSQNTELARKAKQAYAGADANPTRHLLERKKDPSVSAAPASLPGPTRFAVHKLPVARGRRGSFAAGGLKDLAQAGALPHPLTEHHREQSQKGQDAAGWDRPATTLAVVAQRVNKTL